ncbi:MAG: calcium-binding protein [Alphaproteobacteria bacterium]|nr:MAG: calcium-binding protein [Alphaproteobacteria bacterium]
MWLNSLIDDGGTDAAIDVVEGRSFFASESSDYHAWGYAERVGDDLVIHTPAKPSGYHDPGYAAVDVTIVGQFSGNGVEQYVADGKYYDIATSPLGGAGDDLFAGSAARDFQIGRNGDDLAFGNGGGDFLLMGAGNDIALGGDGNDMLLGGDGNDMLYGNLGTDRIVAGAGDDQLYGDEGNDTLIAGAGVDFMRGGAGDDVLKGGADPDSLFGDEGADLLIGGEGGDVYRAEGGDTIRDSGNATTSATDIDIVELAGLYGPSSAPSVEEALSHLSIEVVGGDLLIHIEGADSIDSGTITIEGQRDTPENAIEVVKLEAGYWTPFYFAIVDGLTTPLGDDRTSAGGTTQTGNEILLGTDSDDQIYGSSGTNIIWTGDGADTLVFKYDDPMWDSLYTGYSTPGMSANIVEDFDVTQDKLDFTEMNGLTMDDLSISSQADGDALIVWSSPDIDIASLSIELVGVSVDQLTADLFLFA